MEISMILLRECVQLFLILLLGMLLVKAHLLRSEDSRVLSVVLVYLITPCVIIHAFQIDDTPQVQAGLLYAMAIAVLIHVLFLAANEILKRVLKFNAIQQASIIYSNAGILVVPLVRALLGEEYVIYSCAFIVVQLVLLWTHAESLISGARGFHLKRIIGNVNIIAIVAGAALFLFGIPLPSVVENTMSTLSGMIGPVGMLLAGMVIAQSSPKKLFGTLKNYVPVAVRLLLLPLVVLAVLLAGQAASWILDGKNILMTVYLAAITPTCATLTSIAQLHGCDTEESGELYVLSTILSIVTMPVMIGVFEKLI